MLIPSLELKGAGIALLASSMLHALLLIGCFVGFPSLRKFGSRVIAFSFASLKKVAHIGNPVGARAVADTFIWDLALVWMISQFGTEHEAAAAIILVWVDQLLLPCDGIGTASITYVAGALGANRLISANKWRLHTWLLMTLYTAAAGVLFYLFRHSIAATAGDPQVEKLVLSLSFIVPILMLFYATYNTYDHALCATPDNYWPTIINFGISVIILGPGAMFTFANFIDYQSTAIWVLFTINVAVIAIAFFLRWEMGRWKNMKI
ncbi:MAG: MATE family efflux transporter [Verrucomicrobiota bacterium]